MQLLSELNEQGVTICMVTHDSRYAHFAKRTINLFDGQVVESSVNEQANKNKVDTREIAELIPRELSAEVGA